MEDDRAERAGATPLMTPDAQAPAPETDAPAVGSPNHGPRPAGARVRFVVLHYTAMASVDAARARLCDPAAEVSAHYLIAPDGRIIELAPETRRAWHAGRSAWRGIDDVNGWSIGIELSHPGAPVDRPEGDAGGLSAAPPFPEPQMGALEELLAAIARRYDLGTDAVVAHSDVAPERKRDPGETFDWDRLSRRGLALGPRDAAGPPEPAQAPARRDAPAAPSAVRAAFRAACRRFGYGDWADDALLSAFRRRFRPSALRGARPLDGEDLRRAETLAARDAG